ncbi:MAG: GNAT family N-acetyltransferase [Fimbriimonadaceae bacterium]
MSEANRIGIGAENLSHTYLGIGRAAPGAEVGSGPGFLYCRCDFPHPIGNFGILLEDSAPAIDALAEKAEGRPAFHIYAPTHLDDDDLARRLARKGFRGGYRLCLMLANPSPARCGARFPADVALHQAETVEARDRVARFMGEQFFARHGDEVVRQLAATTTAAPHVLWFAECGHTMVGAVMISRSERALGIYNLCVGPAYQGRGIGAAIVAQVLRLGDKIGKSVVLQCDGSLERWYEGLGFETVGEVQVAALDPRRPRL